MAFPWWSVGRCLIFDLVVAAGLLPDWLTGGSCTRCRTSLHLQRPWSPYAVYCLCCCCERNHPMRHVAQSQCAKVGRGHGRIAGGCSAFNSTHSTAQHSTAELSSAQFSSVVVPKIYLYIHICVLAQTCLRVTFCL